MITDVEHSVAEGLTKMFMDALQRVGQPTPDADKVTTISWRLV
jgi:hypothetical protein